MALFFVTSLLLAVIICHSQPIHPEIVFINIGQPKGEASPIEFILNGNDTTFADHPYIVQVFIDLSDGSGTRRCGGGIFKKKWKNKNKIINIHNKGIIITAAHCTDINSNLDPSAYKVRIGCKSLDFNEICNVYTVSRVIQHEEYLFYQDSSHPDGEKFLNNDIALLILSTDITEPFAEELILPQNKYYDDQFVDNKVDLLGYGRDETGEFPESLQIAKSQTISNEECKSRMDQANDGNGFGHLVISSMICTFDVPKGSCNGDSGSPIVLSHHQSGRPRILVGIVSWGLRQGGFCVDTFPGATTRVSSFVRWIRMNIGGIRRSREENEDYDYSANFVSNNYDIESNKSISWNYLSFILSLVILILFLIIFVFKIFADINNNYKVNRLQQVTMNKV